MSLGKELSHLVEEQIKKSAVAQSVDGGTIGSVSASGSNNGDKLALIEANVQRLAEQLAQMVSTQKKSKRDQIEYGLEVHALHGMRIAVTSGQATFKELEEPLDCPFMYLELSPSLSGRQIRYIYLTPEATLVESTTDPADMEEYIPLAMVDIWAGVTEITQDKVQDIRPRANGVIGDFKAKELVESLLTGNVTVFSTDTGKDSFVIRETAPPSMKVYVTSGRALVDGEVINAEGGELDLSSYNKVEKEFIGVGDGEKSSFSLYHQHVKNVKVYIGEEEKEAVLDEEGGQFSFEEPISEGVEIRASYEFTGNCMAVFFVEKIYADTGKPLGIIGWAVGSNRTPQEPPKLFELQHVIGKAELSDAMATITDTVIDNSYEVVNLTQEELQYGEKLGGSSLQDGAITAKKISANAIIGDHIAAGSIDAAKIVTGAIESQHISAGAILAQHIAADTITADMIKGGTISADKFESSTWGDLTQAIRYVKSILKEQNFWRKPLTIGEISGGVFENISYDTEEYPTLRLKNTRQWDPGHGTLPTVQSGLKVEEINQFSEPVKNFFEALGSEIFFGMTDKQATIEECEKFFEEVDAESFEMIFIPLYQRLSDRGWSEISVEEWIQSRKICSSIVEKWANDTSENFLVSFFDRLANEPEFVEQAWRTVGSIIKHPTKMNEEEIKIIMKKYLYMSVDNSVITESLFVYFGIIFQYMEELGFSNFFEVVPKDFESRRDYLKEMERIDPVFETIIDHLEITLGEPIAPWDTGTWDRPVAVEGWWESPSIDYGKIEDLQAEFWVKPLLISSDHSIQVKFKYSSDNLKWTEYEEGSYNQAMGYYYWIGNFQSYRYVKVKVEMKTSNPENYEILAYPEVRIASATQGNVGDIRFPAMTVKPGELKLNGAVLKRQDYPLLWTWACENNLVVTENDYHHNHYWGRFTSGDGVNNFRLPDVRGVFFRAVDDGRTLDPNREKGRGQGDAIRNIWGSWGGPIVDHHADHSHGAIYGTASGVSGSAGGKYTYGYGFDASRVVPVANENRPFNLAYFACIRYS